jgi:hypothetical protein
MKLLKQKANIYEPPKEIGDKLVKCGSVFQFSFPAR